MAHVCFGYIFFPMSIFNYKQRNVIILVSIIILGCFILYAISGLFSAILGAIVLFTIFRPVFLYLTEKRGWNRPLVALLIILFSLVVIVLPFLALSFMVIGKISDLNVKNIPIQEWLVKVDQFAGKTFGKPHFAEETVQKLGTYAAELFPGLIGSVINIVLMLLVLYFLLYFMLVQIKQFEVGLLKYAPFREQYALKFAEELRNATYSNVLGQGLIAVVQGALLANGFWIAGIPDPLFWGVIGAFISFLPIVGAPTLTIPAAVILYAGGHPVKGLILLLYGVLFIGNIDNVLRMIINKRVSNTHPIITVIGVFIGLPLFGILGLVFGPLLFSYFLLLVEIYETNRMAADRLERIQAVKDE